jgi:hypothetical protein
LAEVPIDTILQIYAAHGEGHIDQIERTLAAQRKNTGHGLVPSLSEKIDQETDVDAFLFDQLGMA